MAKEKLVLEHKVAALERELTSFLVLKDTETAALKQEVAQLQVARSLAVAQAVAEKLKDGAEGRALAFREGMAYAMSTFKEMHQLSSAIQRS